ncbi:DUF5808 domain-containing protein [Sphingobacterium sp. UT-1RO-CII-1]|uniref:DUF5808 domain-containing protein n=1 Tax=Sphingobacterium sp. UT-1RO-CII-1 TaxID=2995225 RepID=UPI00227B1883|nr:DUF5808 domain-containing protein [Sphingobacterium sp. UT-1RO-CII-1]
MKSNFYFGVFYYNPDDPLFFVRKQNNLGWTVNFGHWKKMLFFLIALLLLIYLYNSLI